MRYVIHARRVRRTPKRPVVGLQLGKVFNEIVVMDVEELDDEKFLVMINLATNYGQEGWLKNKTAREIITVFVERWLGVFGAPRRVISDNRLEFQNNEMRRLADQFQIELLSTVVESPWSNGVYERMVGMVKAILQEI